MKKLEGLKYDGLKVYEPRFPDTYVSYVYNNGLTTMDNIYNLWSAMANTDALFWEIKDIIKAMVDFLNGEGLQQHVTEKLTEWLEDGTLEDLINDALFNSKLDKSVFEDFESSLVLDLNKINNKIDRYIIDVTENEYLNIITKDKSEDSQSSNLNMLIELVPEHTTLYFPPGVYYLAETIEIDKSIRFLGTGLKYSPVSHEYKTPYTQIVTKMKGWSNSLFKVSSGTTHVEFERINISHTDWSGTGTNCVGISVGDNLSDSTFFINFKDVTVQNFHVGFNIEKCFKVSFDNCIANGNTTSGFKVHGGGTTTTFLNCWSISNDLGFEIRDLNYSSLIGCASDNDRNISYRLDNVRNTSLISCGSELCGSTVLNITNSKLSLNGIFGYQTGRRLEENSAIGTFMKLENSTVNMTNSNESSRYLDKDLVNSVVYVGEIELKIVDSVFVKSVNSTEFISIDGVYSTNYTPSTNQSRLKIVYNRAYDGSNTLGWVWSTGQSKWIPM